MQRIAWPVILLLTAANAVIALRLFSGPVHLSEMRPHVGYLFQLQTSMDLSGAPASARIFLPQNTEVQKLRSERIEQGRFSFDSAMQDGNRVGTWRAEGLTGHQIATYSALITIRDTTYRIPSGLAIPEVYPDDVARELEPSDVIQSNAPEIRALADSLASPDVATTLRTMFDFVHTGIENSDYENTLDAVTTLKWGEAFCGGKSRLLAALLRASGIPARMVGGVILTSGSKRVSHAWVEAWVNGVWVPFDALNGHFARHPGNYMVIYRGDQVLVSRAPNTNFHYTFNIKKWRTQPEHMLAGAPASMLNAYAFWNAFKEANVSLNLLRILLMLPLGVAVVVGFRHFVGLPTFGTFMPALMAVAFRDTGLLWGIGLFSMMLVMGLGVRYLTERARLLQVARLAVTLTCVVVFMLILAYAAVRLGVLEPAGVSMFPIAILTISVENAFVRLQERGARDVIKITANTLLVVAVTYLIMDNGFAQAVMFVFPEMLFVIVAFYLVAGRWVGLRLFEFYRFRRLLQG